MSSLLSVRADGPADNRDESVRPVPPPGIKIQDSDRSALSASLEALQGKLSELQKPTADRSQQGLRAATLADVAMLHSAVKDALQYNEFFSPSDVSTAKGLVQLGIDRATQLLQGQAPWTTETGLVVRGYRSKLDDSYQPYGLVIPANYQPQGTGKVRLDIWCHGRGETLSEVSFLGQRRTSVGQIAPPDTIVLHLYGRYCNANKLAGEIDCLEALEAVRRQYRIDEDRIVMRGFSMGGAACWQFAVHYPDLFVAAAPGAGFSETPEFLKFFQKETLRPTPWEQTLWHMYDCPDWCLNLSQLPVIAYSGEEDIQKQAADIMETAMANEGLKLVHLIGPKTKHSYHPETAAELEKRLASIVARGRNRVPERLNFVTYTLRYPRLHWLSVNGLERHWDQARVTAQISRTTTEKSKPGIVLTTRNVTDLSVNFEPGWFPFDADEKLSVQIGEQSFPVQGLSDRSFQSSFHLTDGKWIAGSRPVTAGVLRKVPGLQGPIDDAFLDSFLFVNGTRKAAHEKVAKWVEAESLHAATHWRQQFRGHVRMKKDTEINDEDLSRHNLILWGDPSSNAVLARIADKLPIGWNAQQVQVGQQKFDAAHHVPVLIYPNPLNPQRYVVLNSGFTFREYDYLNNARQVPKLPDWAVIDIDTPPSSRYPGKVVTADFFNEAWQLSTP